MSVLVDSSVWIDYFRDTGRADTLDFLIEENTITTNELILAELVPRLAVQRQKKLIGLLREIKRQPLMIDWDEIIDYQTICISHGLNGIGIPDLIIAQNALQGNLPLLSNDKHFLQLANYFGLQIYE